jgi:hypothetical protein
MKFGNFCWIVEALESGSVKRRLHLELKKDPRDRCSMFIYQDLKNSKRYWHMANIFFVTLQWGCSIWRTLITCLHFFYLLPCLGLAGHCSDSMQGVPDVHNFLIFRKLGNLEILLDRGGS